MTKPTGIGRGGHRRGSGRPRNAPLTPIAHLLSVLRNQKVDPARRDAAAIALLPYFCEEPAAGEPLAAPVGKKVEARDRAVRIAASGRFRTPPVPPRLVDSYSDGRR